MTALRTSRWRRYGHDRLYVTTVDERAVGWVDLATGAQTLERAELAVEFAEAIQRWRSHADRKIAVTPTASLASDDHTLESSVAIPIAATVAGRPEVGTEAPEIWRDLAGRRPGEMLAQKAAELRAEAPVANFIARVFGLHTEARAYEIGDRGEVKVGRKLAGLPDAWHCLHSVPVGEDGSDIDHVLVGPGGVFTLNTKHHPNGRVTVYEHSVFVNDRKQPYIQRSRFEARRAAHLLTSSCGLPVTVTPVLVFVGADVTFKSRPADVRIAYRENLIRWLRKLPECLDDNRVAAIYEMARRDATWRGSMST